MRTAMNATFKAKPLDEPILSLIRSRAASLGLVAALGFMLIVSLAARAGLSALEHWSAGKALLSALSTVVSPDEKQREEETTPPRSSDFRQCLKNTLPTCGRSSIEKLRRKLN